ncbi:MAG: nodulation protein NfeD [Chloroflexi bacterium]|nr:nodulation protein NfeD [Chloroflexota bacterium]
MRRKVAVVLLFILAWLLGGTLAASAWAQDGGHVTLLTVKGAIDPLIGQYVGRGIDHAASDGSACVVIQLDTPGGNVTSMRNVVQRILLSPVPVIVYVAPYGARAGSAGVFITYAAHVAAMAPTTNIGAAHPVGGGGEDIPATLSDKITNDASAYIRSIAERRGRNATWAEEAVRKSVSITEREALEAKVIDLIANDLNELLEKVDGRRVNTAVGDVVLKTKGLPAREFPMSLPEGFLHVLIDPNIAYLLFTVGIWAIVAEFYNPGSLLPGITGVICLILAFVAFESLPINWGGVALVVLAVVLFIVDVKAPTHGVLTAGGVISFILGSLLLFSPFSPTTPLVPRVYVNPWIVFGMAGLFTVFFLFAVSAGIRAQRVKLSMGPQALVGRTGVATSEINPVGTVQVASESWTAIADDYIESGAPVQVVDMEGVRLRVRKVP